jgi:hypothetical protein
MYNSKAKINISISNISILENDLLQYFIKNEHLNKYEFIVFSDAYEGLEESLNRMLDVLLNKKKAIEIIKNKFNADLHLSILISKTKNDDVGVELDIETIFKISNLKLHTSINIYDDGKLDF